MPSPSEAQAEGGLHAPGRSGAIQPAKRLIDLIPGDIKTCRGIDAAELSVIEGVGCIHPELEL
jgi:hypothetical protein